LARAVDARGVAVLVPNVAQRLRLERRRLLAATAVGASGIAVFLSLLATGGSPSPLNHLGYVPIVLGAYFWGFRGGVAAAALGAISLGPLLSAAQSTPELAPAWVVRGTMFVTIGAVTGLLFDHFRAMTDAWRDSAVEIMASQRDGMVALARAAEAKDQVTGDHVVRCREHAVLLAREIGLEEERVADIAWSAMLHDIGKLQIPDHVLTKPGPLTEEEWRLIRLHPVYGAEILASGKAFETARRIARWHHENIDGTGYPDGLRGDAIRVIDAWDAMTSDRPYRRALSVERALQELRDGAGTQFDPELVAVFTALVERNARLRGERPAGRRAARRSA
jgi:hypothetical protein